jgi:RNA polymerase sigma-70 factor, ECF subfamily
MEAGSQNRDAEFERIRRAQVAGPRRAQAFEELVREHQAWLVRVLEYLLGNKGDAEDVAQEVFLKAFAALPKFRGDSSFRTWLRVIATRLAFNHRRDNKLRRERNAEVELDPYVLNGSGPVMHRDSLEKVMGELSYPFREILILRHVEELALSEIGKLLDLGASATKMRLARARGEFWRTYEEMIENGT